MDSKSMFSLHVSHALDCLGKSQDMVKFRVEFYKKMERAETFKQRWFLDCITAGSKSEGLTAPLESDLDRMMAYANVFCADDISPFTQLPDCSVFETKRRSTPPGYTKLRMARLAYTMDVRFCDALIKDGNGQFYISSDFFVQCCINLWRNDEFNISHKRSGPAMATVTNELDLKVDTVRALPCVCPQVLQSYFKRHRDYGWPSSNQLIEISCLEGHVVPVGYKGSDTAFLEWRICYTEAESLLVRSLNDTQTKVYILLKMVAKSFINSVALTSYVLKNVVLWLAECQDINTFKEELLVDRFIQALKFIRKGINNNNLPSYFIPERNLISGKLDLGQRKKMVILLTGLINEVGGVLMSCERLRGTMLVLYKEPARAVQYKCKRDMIEKLFLSAFEIVEEVCAASASEEQQIELMLRNEKFFILLVLMFEDNLSLILEGDDASTGFQVKNIVHQWLG